jgi:G6PDH family F420-dependent oxidoreductase
MSGFGDKAIELAARIADGFITTQPAGDDLSSYRAQGGRGPTTAGAKVCFGQSKEESVALAHRLWPNIGLPGELAQVLPSPKHFEQASEIVTPEMVGGSLPCGPDLDEHISKLKEYAEAGFDELYISQIGPHSEEFFKAYESEVLPALRST